MGSNDITAMGHHHVPLLASTGTEAYVANDFPDTGKGFQDADHMHIRFKSELDGELYDVYMRSDEKHPEWGFKDLEIVSTGGRLAGELHSFSYNADAPGPTPGVIHRHQTLSIANGPSFELTNIQVGSISPMEKFQPASQLKIHDGEHEIKFQSENFTPDEAVGVPALVEERITKPGELQYQRVMFTTPEVLKVYGQQPSRFNVFDAEHVPKRELPPQPKPPMSPLDKLVDITLGNYIRWLVSP